MEGYRDFEVIKNYILCVNDDELRVILNALIDYYHNPRYCYMSEYCSSLISGIQELIWGEKL